MSRRAADGGSFANASSARRLIGLVDQPVLQKIVGIR